MVVIVTINWQQRVVTQTLSSKVNLKNGENSKNTAKRYRRWARKETTVQVAIIRLKKRKAILKTLFTLTKHQLTHLLGGDELSSWDKIHEVRANLFDQQQVRLIFGDAFKSIWTSRRPTDSFCEEIETINKEFKDVMEQANYQSQRGCKGSTLSTTSHQSSKRSQLTYKESLAQEHLRRITMEVKQKQIKLIDAQKELEDKYKSENWQWIWRG